MLDRGWLNRLNTEFTRRKITTLGNITGRKYAFNAGLQLIVYQYAVIDFNTGAFDKRCVRCHTRCRND